MNRNNKLKVWIIRVVLLILIGFWMYTIWGFSAEDGNESQSLSDKITIKIVKIIEPDYNEMTVAEQEDIFDTVSFYVRKTGHCGEFAILAVLFCCLLLTYPHIRSLKKGYVVVLATAYGMCYGAVDETHQLFVEGRDGSVRDVAIDTFGALLGALFVLIILILIEQKRGKNKMWQNNLRQITPYTPGEQPKGEKIIKLNTNECPYAPSPKVEVALKSMDYSNYRLYPDPEANELVDAIADYYKVPVNKVFVGVGSDDVLGMAFMAFFNSDKPILFPDITYSFYDVWAELLKVPYETVEVDDNFKIRKEDYYRDNGGIVFPNPNAPTAIEMSLDEVEDIVKNNQQSVVIVDEAYIDFGTQTALPLIDKYENLLVVRTYSKSRAMAGMRIGYAIGSKKLIDALKMVKFSYNSYTMNMPSIKAGAAAIADGEYFNEIVEKIVATRENAKERLAEMGFEFTDSKTNFLFAKHKSVKAEVIFEELKKRNIYVRYFKKPRIDNYLRITIGTDEEMEKLYQALEEIL